MILSQKYALLESLDKIGGKKKKHSCEHPRPVVPWIGVWGKSRET